MKYRLFFSLILLLLCGYSSVLAEQIPNLTGDWSGTSVGHSDRQGYAGDNSGTLALHITGQQGMVFNGTVDYLNSLGVLKNKTCSGAIDPEDQKIYLSESTASIDIGRYIPPDTIRMIYLETGNETDAAFVDTFVRK